MFYMDIKKTYFDLIRDGTKDVEGRKNSPTWSWVEPGVKFTLRSGNETLEVKCVATRLYASLEEYLMKEGLARTLPGVESVEEGVKIYLQWSTEVEVKRWGIKAIQLEMV